jgi:hypothetical protein
MTGKKGSAMDGYSKSKPLTEGLVRKGGSNSATSQIQTRPAAPAPMKPVTPQGVGTAKPTQGAGTKQGN